VQDEERCLKVETARTIGDRYQVGALLGHGGMADVFAGTDLRLSRPVAIKILRSDLARDPSFQVRFRREAQAAAALNHPNVVAVFDTGEEVNPWGNVPYIVMEYVEGTTLRDLLRQGDRIAVDRALEITHGILTALEYSHRNGLIHRDIKPGNVMITPSGSVKVVDFGIARALDDVSATVTHTSSILGTAAYLSPEQARGESVDVRSDLYAVGCVLYELLTSRPPFVGDSPVSVAYQHVREDAAPPSVYVEDLNPEVDAVVMTALTKNADNRYQTATAMLDDIDRLRSGRQVSAGPLLGDRTTRMPRAAGTAASGKQRRSQLINGLLIATLILSLGILGFFVGRTVFGNGADPVMVIVPDVRGLTESDARDVLEGFAIETRMAPDPLIPEGRVTAQNPNARMRVSSGSLIILTISEGAGQTNVPGGLIGLSLDQARELLRNAGLVIARTNPVNSDQPPGTVLAVSPDAGTQVPSGSGVVLDIASGNVTVPDVRGKGEIEARTILIQAGFNPRLAEGFDASQPLGVVLAQAPEAGGTRPSGSVITITINRQPPDDEDDDE
jgi:eukaryotic-like serine/threonine-protein kinase